MERKHPGGGTSEIQREIIGRLLIHLYAQRRLSAKAQNIASECLALDPGFKLADALDVGNMFQHSADAQEEIMAQQLMNNLRIKGSKPVVSISVTSP